MKLFTSIILGFILGAILCFICISLYRINEKVTYLHTMIQEAEKISPKK